MDYRQTIRLHYDYVMPSYKRVPIVFRRGKNTRLWDTEGNEYLDFFSGYVVSGTGHGNRHVTDAVKRQIDRLVHVPNTFYHEPQGLLAERLIRHAFPGKVFFANSGAEAVEGAVKLARCFGHPDRHEIISMERSFHGRTFAALTATGQPKFHEGLGPLVPGFKSVPFNDIQSVRAALSPRTAAILIEPVQGEGGVRVAAPEYLKELRRLCDEKGILLILDEVQTGMGRTGRMFAFQTYGVTPDVMTLAKSLGGGFAIGAVVARPDVADLFQPGVHASTFGGNPVACAAGLGVFEAIEKERLLENAFLMGEYLMRRLKDLASAHACVREARGLGLLAALELDVSARPVYEACLEERLILNVTQETVLRLAPPLTVQKKEVDRAMTILDSALTRFASDQKGDKEPHGQEKN